MAMRKYITGRPGSADELNGPLDDLLTQSGYDQSGSDFAGFAKKDAVNQSKSNALDHRATVPEIAYRNSFTPKTDKQQVVKLPNTLTNLGGLIRVGDRLFGVDGPLPVNKQGSFIRFDNLDDLSSYQVAPIPTLPPAGSTTGAWNLTYSPAVNRLFAVTQNGRLMRMNPDTLAIDEVVQLATINGNAGDPCREIQADGQYIFIISYSSGGNATPSGLGTRVIRYLASNLAQAPLVLDIDGAARCEGSGVARGKLYLQGQWSHSYGASFAHSWVARIDTATLALEQLVRLPNEWDSSNKLCIAGDFIFVGCGNPKGPQFYRIKGDDLTAQVLIHTGIPETFVGCVYDGKYVWAMYVGATVGAQRFIRVDPETLWVTRYKVPDASTAETTVPPQPYTVTLISDGERLFVQMNNISSVSGASDIPSNSLLGPYLQRVVLLEPTGQHSAIGGIPSLSIGQDSFGHGRLLSSEAAGIHSVGSGLRLQALATPAAPSADPVAPELGGQPANTTYNYYVVAVDAFGRRSLPSPVGAIVGAAILGGMAFQRIGWAHVDGAVSYDVLRGDTSTKIGSTLIPSFLDDGKVGVAYTPPTKNETGFIWADGKIGQGDNANPQNNLDSFTQNSTGDAIPPTFRQQSNNSIGFTYHWKQNNSGVFSVMYLFGSANPGVTQGGLSRANLSEWITFGGGIAITCFTGDDISLGTGNVRRFAVKGDGSGVELYMNGGKIFAKSPDGTRYRLQPPNGGGAAIWVAEP